MGKNGGIGAIMFRAERYRNAGLKEKEKEHDWL